MTGSPFVESVYSGRTCPHELIQNGNESDFEEWYRVLEPVDSGVLNQAHHVELEGHQGSPFYVADWMEGLDSDLDAAQLYAEVTEGADELTGWTQPMQVIGLEKDLQNMTGYKADQIYDGLTVAIYDNGFEADFAIPLEREKRQEIIDEINDHDLTPFNNHHNENLF